MKRLGPVRLVAGREITERLSGRAIWVLTALTTLLVVLGIVLPAVLRSSPSPTVVGLLGRSAQALGPSLEQTAKAAQIEITLVHISDPADARDAVESGKVDVVLDVSDNKVDVEVKESLSTTAEAIIRATVDADHQAQVLGRAGVAPSVISQSRQPVPLQISVLNPSPPDNAGRDIAAVAAAILTWVSISLYGTVIANGVAQEKTSRTAEVLLATVRPGQLLNGKVLGIGACGIGQMVITIGAGLIANSIVHATQIPTVLWQLLPAVLLWFLLGYALYSYAFAAAGSLVARQEEIQLVTAPFSVVLVGSYLLTYAAIASPNALWLRILSFFPPLAPVLMPARIALGHLAPWELPLAVVITIVFIVGVSRGASVIYSSSVMRGGPRLSLREAVRRSCATA